jgi:preprotein translocase subunit SecE
MKRMKVNMNTRLLISLCIVTFSITGCGTSANGASSAPADTASLQAAKQSADSQSHQASDGQKASFIPLLDREYAKVTWPKTYKTTTAHIWQVVSSRAGNMVLDENMAKTTVQAYNQCAWVMDAVDKAKAGKSVDEDHKGIRKSYELTSGDDNSFLEGVFRKAALGDVSDGQSFIKANECAKVIPAA